ncbi:MAG TPA: hypothetical protein VHI31_08930 [Actinomycetota bacterium]|nr:hypothetical protein [Actinomycetota bacterium]
MADDSQLYELVWGEPAPPSGHRTRPPADKPAPLPAQSQVDRPPDPHAQSPAQQDVLARLDAIEASMSELLQAVQKLGSPTMSHEMILISLEALESRMGRMEKGLVRSLEYLESKIGGSRRR